MAEIAGGTPPAIPKVEPHGGGSDDGGAVRARKVKEMDKVELTPPVPPSPGDCCGSGCVRCVWDVYYEDLDKYEGFRDSNMKKKKISKMSKKGKEIVNDSKKTKWTDELTEVFIDLCIKKSKKMGPTNKWHWKWMVTEFISLSGTDFSSAVLKNRYDNLKQNWQLWNKLKSKEIGSNCNNTRGIIDASDEWWMTRIEDNPQYKKFWRAPLKFVEKLDLLFNGRVAIGGDIRDFSQDDSCIQTSMTSPLVPALDKDDIIKYQSTGSSQIKSTSQTPTCGSSGKRLNIESSSKPRKKKTLERRTEMYSKLEKCIEVMQSRFERKKTATMDKSYDDAMSALLSLNLGDEDDTLLYFGIQLFESEAQRLLFVRTPEHKRLGYLRAIYAIRIGGGTPRS